MQLEENPFADKNGCMEKEQALYLAQRLNGIARKNLEIPESHYLDEITSAACSWYCGAALSSFSIYIRSEKDHKNPDQIYAEIRIHFDNGKRRSIYDGPRATVWCNFGTRFAGRNISILSAERAAHVYGETYDEVLLKSCCILNESIKSLDAKKAGLIDRINSMIESYGGWKKPNNEPFYVEHHHKGFFVRNSQTGEVTTEKPYSNFSDAEQVCKNHNSFHKDCQSDGLFGDVA